MSRIVIDAHFKMLLSFEGKDIGTLTKQQTFSLRTAT